MTTVTRAQMDSIVDEHFRFEANDDIDGVLSTLVEDVDHDVVGSPLGPLRKREDARAVYEAVYADFEQHKLTTLHRYYGDGFLVDESLWEGISHGNLVGIPGTGKPVAFRILHVFEVADDGRIRRENAWLDYATLVQQLSDE